jgi:hypothetical protein
MVHYVIWILMQHEFVYLLPAGAEDADRHHLYAGSGRGGGDWVQAPAQAQVVELMERSSVNASAHYIEDRLRRRGRSESQQQELDSIGGGGGSGSGGAPRGSTGGGGFPLLPRQQPLFSGASASQASAQAQALASAGGRQLRQWKDSLLHKLKKVASQPALAVAGGASSSSQQSGLAFGSSSTPLIGGSSSDSRGERTAVRQRAPSLGSSRKAD